MGLGVCNSKLEKCHIPLPSRHGGTGSSKGERNLEHET